MKKLYILLFVGLIVSITVLCGSQIIEAKAEDSGNKGKGEEAKVEEKKKSKAGNADELKEIVDGIEQELEQETNGLKEKQQNVYKNQNRVRLAVHSLLAMENLIGGIGPEVSKIASEFNNSLGKTIITEEKIQNKNRIIRFLLGGDKESAELMMQEVIQNKDKVEQLKQLMEECDCDERVKDMLKEQIINIETEQDRLELLAKIEEGYKGLFDRLFGWLF